MRVVLLGDLLQEVEGLLEHAEQVLLELHRHTVLGHEFIDAGHGQHAQAAPLLPQHRVVAAAVHRGHLAGAGVAAEARKVEDGGEQGRGDARGQRDPAEQVGQALQGQAADVFTVRVQDGDGLVQQFGCAGALQEATQEVTWGGERCQAGQEPLSAQPKLDSDHPRGSLPTQNIL